MDAVVGKNFKAWRMKIGYSQEEIANFLGITRENISYFENGERDIPIKHLEKISDLFGIEPDLLFNEDMSVQDAEMAFAFRNGEATSNETMENISRFKRIVQNYLMMKRKIDATN